MLRCTASRLRCCILALLVVGCDDDPINRSSSSVEHRLGVARTPGPDATQPSDVAQDTGRPSDTDPGDSSPSDTGPSDTGASDTGPSDTGASDTGPSDTGPSDTGDTGPSDTTEPDVVVAPYPARYPPDRVHSPITASVVARLQAIAAIDPALQDDVFMKVGASTTVSPSAFKCFGSSDVDLDTHTELASTLDFFLDGDADGGDPFSRTTLAAKSGVSATWAITGDPSPLEDEYLHVRPRFAFIHYGTNDMGLGATYQSALFAFVDNLWTLVDDLLAWGVVPSLATILHRLDVPSAERWVSTYNGVIIALAQGRQIPLVDLFLAYEPLPNHGLGSDGLHSSLSPEGACVLTPTGLAYGYNMRNLQMLTALSRLEAAVLDGEASDAPGPAPEGLGTLDDPIVIDGLPFHDLRSTVNAPSSELDRYSGCASTADESGGEVVYRFVVTQRTRLRATVHDRGTTDIDLHLLDETASEAGCIARNHQIIEATLEPGTYHFALDTFVTGAGPRSGEYILSIVPCPADDSTCG